MVLDGPELAELAIHGPHGADDVPSILLHELAHLVGLGHVEDPNQLMFPDAGNAVELGPGDLGGLAELGRGRCFPLR